MANTPFLDLVKPAGTDRALVSVINSNSDKIDTGVSTLSEQIDKYQGTKSWVSNADCNTYTSQGYFLLSSNPTNAPFASWFQLIVLRPHADVINQIAIKDSVYAVRTCGNGTWTSWDKFALDSNLQISQRKITTTVAATIDTLAKFNSVLADAGQYYIETNASIRTTFISLGLLPENLVGNLEARKIASNYFFLHFQSYSNREWIATIDNGTLSAWQELVKAPNITEIKIVWDSTINKPTLEVTGTDGHKHKFIGETIS